MNAHPTLRLLTLSILATLCAAPAMAQDSNCYFGLGAGQSLAYIDETGLARAQLGAGPTISGISTSDADGQRANVRLALDSFARELQGARFDAITVEPSPVTKVGDCPGVESPQLIVCLQPGRRVETEVTGTR